MHAASSRGEWKWEGGAISPLGQWKRGGEDSEEEVAEKAGAAEAIPVVCASSGMERRRTQGAGGITMGGSRTCGGRSVGVPLFEIGDATVAGTAEMALPRGGKGMGAAEAMARMVKTPTRRSIVVCKDEYPGMRE